MRSSPLSRRQALHVIGLPLATGLAGCGTENPGQPTPSATNRPTVSPTETPTDIVPYRKLSDEGQATFQRLLDEGSVTGAKTDFPTDIWLAGLVTYDGTMYAVEREPSGHIAEYWLARPTRVNESDIEDKSQTIAFEELSPAAKDVFDRAPTRPTRERWPEQLHEHQYVKHEAAYYELSIGHGDLPEWELSVSVASE